MISGVAKDMPSWVLFAQLGLGYAVNAVSLITARAASASDAANDPEHGDPPAPPNGAGGADRAGASEQPRFGVARGRRRRHRRGGPGCDRERRAGAPGGRGGARADAG